MILLRILLRILIEFYKDFTTFYGVLKKMVQKNQYTYNVPPGSSAPASINEARRAEFDGNFFCAFFSSSLSFSSVFLSGHLEMLSTLLREINLTFEGRKFVKITYAG